MMICTLFFDSTKFFIYVFGHKVHVEALTTPYYEWMIFHILFACSYYSLL